MKRKGLAVGLIQVLAIACCVPAPTTAQPDRHPMCDSLSPRWSRMSTPSGFWPHDAAIGKALFERQHPARQTADAPALIRIAMVIEEPGSPESAVYVLETPPEKSSGVKYTVVYAVARDFLSSPEANPGATLREAELDSDALKAISQAWEAMTVSARWPSPELSLRRLGPGQAVYTFTHVGERLVSEGETVTIQPGTCSNELVHLGKTLIAFAQASDESQRAKLRQELLSMSSSIVRRVSQGKWHPG